MLGYCGGIYRSIRVGEQSKERPSRQEPRPGVTFENPEIVQLS